MHSKLQSAGNDGERCSSGSRLRLTNVGCTDKISRLISSWQLGGGLMSSRLQDARVPFLQIFDRALAKTSLPASLNASQTRAAGHGSSTSAGLQAPARSLRGPNSYQVPLAASLPTSTRLEARSRGLPVARACSFFATCHPGLEQAVARELSEAVPGIAAIQPGRAGVSFRYQSRHWSSFLHGIKGHAHKLVLVMLDAAWVMLVPGIICHDLQSIQTIRAFSMHD